MRTTLTLDDTLVSSLKRTAAARNLPFKTVVNQALRLGLEAMEESAVAERPYSTRPRSLELRPGYDADKLGQEADENDDGTRLRGER